MAVSTTTRKNGSIGGAGNLDPGEGRIVHEFNGSTTFSKTVGVLELVKLVKALPTAMQNWKTGRYCITIECEYVRAAAKRPAAPKKAPARKAAAMH